MIAQSEIENVASLARLQLSEKEKEKLQKDLDSVLGFIEKLKELDVSGVEPTVSGGGRDDVVRKDEPLSADISAFRHFETAAAMLKQAPDQKDGFVKVKAILGEKNI